ncbi:glycosyltransferase [Microbacterium sp. HJ5]
MTTPVLQNHPATATLPRGRHLAVTWGIPEEYGGMTAALMHRSRAFASIGRAVVEIVTFDPDPRWTAVRRRLSERGELSDGMLLRNPYEDIRLRTRAPVAVDVTPGGGQRASDEEVTGEDGSVRRWTSGERLERAEHRRADGTLALLDEHRSDGTRLMTAFDGEGATTGQWRSATDFYFAWLDEVIGGEPATAIVDSKAVAPLMQRYRRDNVTGIYLLHGSHLAGQDPSVLDESRLPVLENLHLWDAVVLQTERQRDDLAALLGDTGNLEVVPNPMSVPPTVRRLPPDRFHGVIVSRLSALKRVDHALRIIAAARELGLPVTAEIIGDGRQRARLEQRARDLGLERAVRFTGYASDGPEHFAAGAWTLLTSRSEGGSLTLVEAMAAGCLPISYDVRYGPADVVEHDRNGWLVPDSDIAAAARALSRACVLSDDDLAARRYRAHRTALSRDERSIVTMWAEVERAARDRHAPSHEWPEPLGRIRVRHLRGRYVVTALLAPSVGASADVEVRLIANARAIVRRRMRGIGAIRVARLSVEESARLGHGAVRVRFTVDAGSGIGAVDAGTRHPDPRSFVRRLVDLGRRRLAPTRR